MTKRSNIPIRILPIETDLQALIKSIDDDAQKINGTESTGVDHQIIETTTNNDGYPSKVDSCDEKDVIIKLYNPEVNATQRRRRSSSLGSIEAIQNVSICDINFTVVLY